MSAPLGFLGVTSTSLLCVRDQHRAELVRGLALGCVACGGIPRCWWHRGHSCAECNLMQCLAVLCFWSADLSLGSQQIVLFPGGRFAGLTALF